MKTGRWIKYALLAAVFLTVVRHFSGAQAATADRVAGFAPRETILPVCPAEPMRALVVETWSLDATSFSSGLFRAKTNSPVVRVNPYSRFTSTRVRTSRCRGGLPLSAWPLSVVAPTVSRPNARRDGYYIVALRKIIV